MATTHTNTTKIPQEWPGAFGIYTRSQKAVITNIGIIVILGLIPFAASIIFAILFNHDALEQTLVNIVSIILGPVFIIAILRGIEGKKISLSDAFKDGVPFVLPYFLVSILVGLALLGSILALLVPFFFVMPRLLLAEYFVVDKKMNAIDAFRASWNETKGHSAKVWGIIGASIVMLLPVFTIVGIPVAIFLLVMYSASTGILYKYITQQKPTA